MISITDGAEALVLSFLLPVLEKEWHISDFEKSVLGSSTFVGFFVGCLISGQLADRVGRKWPLIVGVFLNFSFGFLSSIAQDYKTLGLLRLFFGIAVGIISPLSATYMCEITPIKLRGKMLIFTGTFFTVGELITCMIAYLFLDTFDSGNWRALVMWSAVPGVLTFILCCCYLEESPRYLLAFQKYDEAFKLINRIIKMNHKTVITGLTQEEKDHLQKWGENQNKKHENQSFGNPAELFREGRLRITPFLWVMWYVLSCVYYGNIFILPTILQKMNVDQIEGSSNEFKDVFLSVLAELPSSILTYLLIEVHFLGRKNSMIITFGVTSIFSFIAFKTYNTAFLIVATIARFFLNMAFSFIYPFTTEVYPTRIRATGLGVASSFSRIGGMSMPWISIASMKISTTGPFLIYGILSLLAAVCSWILPYDTTGIELDNYDHESTDPDDQGIAPGEASIVREGI